MKLGHIIKGMDVVSISGDNGGDVSALCYSAKQCEPSSLFVAIAGMKHDGHDFIDEAIERGARYIVHEKDFQSPGHIVSIKVSDSRRALGLLSKNYFWNPSAKMVLIAVTGTSGKTTTAYLLESILKAAGFNCGVLGTVNYRFNKKVYPAPNTTPESYEMQKILRQMIDEGVTHVIAEVSSHAIDLKRIDDCDFDLGIFTNLSSEHLDYHQTMEAYFQAKKRLFSEVLPRSKKKYTQKMIINADDEWGQRILQEAQIPSLTYGLAEQCAISVKHYDLSLDGIKAALELNGNMISVSSSLIGRFNLYNMMAAAGTAGILGVSSSVIKSGIENLSSVPGRLERIETSFGASVFVDYAHKPDALTQVLQNLSRLKKKRIITVFGCGGNRDRVKRPLMGAAAANYSDLTIITSDNPRLEEPMAIIAEIEEGVDKKKFKRTSLDNLKAKDGQHLYVIIPDRREAIASAINAAETGDIVLIAGKGHEDYQILGTQKINFDDRVEAARALELRDKLK